MSRTPEDLTNLESALAGLAPSATALNRDRMLFEAGRQSASRRAVWPAVATVFAGLSAVLGLQLMLRPEPTPRTVEIVVHVPAETASAAPITDVVPPTLAESNPPANWGNAFRTSTGYLSRRDQLLHFGTESLPAAPAVPDALPDPRHGLKAHSL